jgi:hypothetical protein
VEVALACSAEPAVAGAVVPAEAEAEAARTWCLRAARRPSTRRGPRWSRSPTGTVAEGVEPNRGRKYGIREGAQRCPSPDMALSHAEPLEAAGLRE